MDKVRQKKQYETQLRVLKSDAEVLKVELGQKQREYCAKLLEIDKIKDKIEELKSDNSIKISEHAILRYFERIKGYNISDIEKEIITEDVKKLVETLGGNGKYPFNDFQLVLKDFTVTTII